MSAGNLLPFVAQQLAIAAFCLPQGNSYFAVWNMRICSWASGSFGNPWPYGEAQLWYFCRRLLAELRSVDTRQFCGDCYSCHGFLHRGLPRINPHVNAWEISRRDIWQAMGRKFRWTCKEDNGDGNAIKGSHVVTSDLSPTWQPMICIAEFAISFYSSRPSGNSWPLLWSRLERIENQAS